MQASGFGYWLAGFVDGEGCFIIAHKGPRSGRLQCALRVQVRSDDLPILVEIRQRTGVGYIVTRGARPTQPNPGVVWQVQNRADCLRLVEWFDRHPLRARKAQDYAIWREAVVTWAKVRRGGPAIVPINEPYWQEMERLRSLMNAGRAYDPRPDSLAGNNS